MEEMTTIVLIEKLLDWLIGAILVGFPSLMILDFLLMISSRRYEPLGYPIIADPWNSGGQSTATKVLPASQSERLTFAQLHKEYSSKGLRFEKHSSGHYRYRVILDSAIPPKQFKNLLSAKNWLKERQFSDIPLAAS